MRSPTSSKSSTRRRGQPVDNPAALVMRSGHIVGLANHTVLIDRRRHRASDRRQRGADSRSSNGRIIGVVLVFRDVTEERRAEEAIAEQREWFETTLESIGDAVIATDVQGRVEFMNPIAEHLTGWRLSDARGQNVRRGVPDRQRGQPPYRREPGDPSACRRHDRRSRQPHRADRRRRNRAPDRRQRRADPKPRRPHRRRRAGVSRRQRATARRTRAARCRRRARAPARGRARRARRRRAREPREGRVRRDGVARASHAAERDPRMDAVDDEAGAIAAMSSSAGST